MVCAYRVPRLGLARLEAGAHRDCGIESSYAAQKSVNQAESRGRSWENGRKLWRRRSPGGRMPNDGTRMSRMHVRWVLGLLTQASYIQLVGRTLCIPTARCVPNHRSR